MEQPKKPQIASTYQPARSPREIAVEMLTKFDPFAIDDKAAQGPANPWASYNDMVKTRLIIEKENIEQGESGSSLQPPAASEAPKTPSKIREW